MACAVRHVGAVALLAVGTLLWSAWLTQLGCGAWPAQPFDGALFLLAPIYVSQGLIPYRDVGSVYPPGSALLFGRLLGLGDVAALDVASALAIATITLGNVWWLRRLTLSTEGAVGLVGGYLGLSGLVIALWSPMGAEPFTPYLMAGLLVLAAGAIGRATISRSEWGTAAVYAAVATMLRWDRVPALVAVQCALVAGLVLAGVGRLDRRGSGPVHLGGLASLGAAQFAGVGVAVGAWLATAAATGTFEDAVVFVFALHRVIRPYRSLPFPGLRPMGDPEALFLVTLLALVIGAAFIIVRAWRSRQSTGVSRLLCLMVLPLSVVPYALGRADYEHSLPFFASTGVVLLLCVALSRDILCRAACLAGLVLLMPPVSSIVREHPPWPLSAECGRRARDIEAQVSDCRSLLPPEARSLFIGRTSYSHFVINAPILYFADVRLRPATRFLSDEPGVQNSCTYGERIASDLAGAPKPMVALLETTVQAAEPNATRTMTSCGRIEAFLGNAPRRTLGVCRHLGRPLEAVLYY